ncbi:MAG: NAD(P)H-dependent oxidoreductase subunit E [Candidatus Nanopelagicales bacterium]
MALTENTRTELQTIADKYPQARSALLPMFHLVQSEEGYVSVRGIELCAEVVDLSLAEVSAVASFYTMFKRHPVGEHHIGVCVNPQCGVLGGEAIWDALTDNLGIGHDETTPDGKLTIERIECQAACTYAPSCTVDWEFVDDMSVDKMRDLVAKLQADEPVDSSRGPQIRSFRATERTLAGFDDGLSNADANCADAVMLRGLTVAKERGMTTPTPDGSVN